MPRNLDRRIETLAPVESLPLKARLWSDLEVDLADDTLAWLLTADGAWERSPRKAAERVETHHALRQRALELARPTPPAVSTLAVAGAADDVDHGVGRYDPEGRVRAAGGLLWRRHESGVEVALIHRPEYDDWSFPKGKRDEGETDEQAAVREIEEETGARVVLGHELAHASYIDSKGRPKFVRYWEAEVAGDLQPDNEVDEIEWVGLKAARKRLSYPHDIEVLRSFEGLGLV
jgi:8-oxo-dGTP pyrophosphatase MutT (NUDIX family)